MISSCNTTDLATQARWRGNGSLDPLPSEECIEATSLTTGERSDTETVTLRSERGDWKRAMVGWYLASRLLNLAYPFQKRTLIMAQPVLFFTIYESAGGVKESRIIVYFLILERICYVASTACEKKSLFHDWCRRSQTNLCTFSTLKIELTFIPRLE